MGVEVKGAGDGVVIADRGCNDGCCGNRNYGCSSEDYWRYYNGITNCHTRMIRKEYIYQGCTPFFVLTT